MTGLPVSAIWRPLPGTFRFQPTSLLTNLLYWGSLLSMQRAQNHDFVLCKPLEIPSEVSGLLLTQYGDKNPLRGHSLFPVHTGDQTSVSRCTKSPDPTLCPPIPLLPSVLALDSVVFTDPRCMAPSPFVSLFGHPQKLIRITTCERGLASRDLRMGTKQESWVSGGGGGLEASCSVGGGGLCRGLQPVVARREPTRTARLSEPSREDRNPAFT